MPLLVESPSAGPAGELEVLPRGQGRPAGPAVLGEALDDHRPGWHVDAQREGFGGEDDLEQPGREALLDGLPEDRDEAGVMRRHASLEAFEPLVVAEHPEVLVSEGLDPALGDLPYGGALVRVGQA